jgi:2-keto-3-deoxy-L-rhamnonate aldolase RhmA
MSILQAVGNRIPCIVRVPELAEVPIKKVLDLGAAGIIVPQVNTAEQAAQAVAYAKYAPDGTRGVGLARAHGYGMRFHQYMASANEQTLVVVQAEHALAVQNIEAIVKVPGIDAIQLGPYDLSASLGKMGQLEDPAVAAAIDRVISVCRAAGMPLGYFGVNADSVRPYMERGCSLIVAGVDTLFLGSGAARLLADLRGTTPSQAK